MERYFTRFNRGRTLEDFLLVFQKLQEIKWAPSSGRKCKICRYYTITVTFTVKTKDRNNINRQENLICSSEKVLA